MDIWDDDGVAINRNPAPRETSVGWYADVENQPVLTRGRKLDHMRPNKRAAVPVPMAGQSYRPTEEDHQQTVRVVASKLTKLKSQHDAFTKERQRRKKPEYKGDLNTDKLWEEEVVEGRRTPMPSKSALKRAQLAKAKSGKKTALDLRRENRANRSRARHPDRRDVADDVGQLDQLMAEVDEETKQSELRHLRRRVRRSEGQQTPKYGRHMHTPLVPDVLPTSAAAGKLRHMKPANAAHPALDRLKSLEERGVVPARMRHTYNKRAQLRPKGEVRVVHENFGGLVE
jgi:hypothetical protein